MININDIIKLSDYKDIYLESKDCFVYKTERKKYNIKGSNVEKYVYPIFYEMFQPNFVFDLLQNINDKSKDKETDNEICEDDFSKIVFKLYNLGIIEVVKEDSLLREKESMTNNFKMFNINDEEMNNIVKSKDITIINSLNRYNFSNIISKGSFR